MSDFEERLRDDLHDLAAGAEPPPTLAQNIDSRLVAGTGWSGPLPSALMAVAAAIVITAIAVFATRGNNGGRRVVLTSPTSTTAVSTTTTALGVLPGLPDTAVSVPDSTTVPPAPSTSTTSVQATTTTGATSTTTTVHLAECLGSGLQSATSTDQSTYPQGATVTITVTVNNTSGRRCQIANPYPNAFTEPVKVTFGPAVIWQPGTMINGVVAIPTPKVLDPGQSYTWATVQWKQDICRSTCTEQDGSPKPQAPSGDYQATALSAPVGTPAKFTIK